MTPGGWTAPIAVGPARTTALLRRIGVAVLAPGAALCALLVLSPSGTVIWTINHAIWEVVQALLGWLPFAEALTPVVLERVWNVVMFVPLGLGVTLIHPRWWWAILLSLASLGIESAQFLFFPNRLPEVADIVTNSLGGLIGVAAAIWIVREAARRGRMAR